MLENKWLVQPTDYWCARPAGMEGVDPETWVNMSAPLKDNGNYDRCRTFDVDYELDELERPPEDTPTRECTEFEYDTSQFRNTAIQRWDLVCSKQYIPSYVQTIFFVGNFVGVIASGPIADTFGRKFCYCLFVTIWIASGVIGSMAGNLYVWITTRFVCGAMSLGYNNVLSAYSTELTSGKWRAKQGYFFGANAWDSGVILLGFMAYMIRDMQMLELTIALSNIPFLLAWFLMQESPRWLLSKGKKDRAKVVITRVCKLNKRPVHVVEPFVDNFEMTEEEQKGNIMDLFRTPNIRRNTLLMCLCWLSFSMGYFGLFYNIPAFNWSPFIVFIIPAIPSIPSNFIEPHLENILGRKVMLTASLLLAGTFLFLTLTFPKEHPGIIVCAWVGAYFCGIAFGAGYTYTKELYPTVLRSTALGTASAAARIGSILSPTIALTAAIHTVSNTHLQDLFNAINNTFELCVGAAADTVRCDVICGRPRRHLDLA